MLELAKNYHKVIIMLAIMRYRSYDQLFVLQALEEEEGMTKEQLVIKNVGKPVNKIEKH